MKFKPGQSVKIKYLNIEANGTLITRLPKEEMGALGVGMVADAWVVNTFFPEDSDALDTTGESLANDRMLMVWGEMFLTAK